MGAMSTRTKATSKVPAAIRKAEQALRAHGMKYPEVIEDFPWGHRTLKVNGKAFVFMTADATGFSMSVKLPESNGAALSMPFAEPTGYGMGKHGWVTASFKPKHEPPVDLLKQWLDESYRAVAPKRLVKQLDASRANN